MTAVVKPGRAVGSTTRHTVCHCDAPNARLASRSPFGTTRNTTSDARAMTGSIITLIANAAANPDRGNPRNKMTVTRMNRPATIDGNAVIDSTTVRTSRDPPTTRPRSGTPHTRSPTAPSTRSRCVIMINVPAMRMQHPTLGQRIQRPRPATGPG